MSNVGHPKYARCGLKGGYPNESPLSELPLGESPSFFHPMVDDHNV
jgi:hypothetical protein